MNFANRDFAAFSKRDFDLVVIGGGINGLAIAWDATLRGHSVLLLEKSDFGGATSSACFKVIHGGLRYLQRLDLKHLRESVNEQRILRTIAPHLVHPLPFLVPCYGYGKRGRVVLKIAFTLYDILAADRNRGVAASHRLPPHRYLSKEEVLQFAPHLSQRGLKGGFLYYDCQLSNCERLTLSVARAAHAAGATLVNYAEVTAFNLSSSESAEKINNVRVKDSITGAEFNVTGKLVVNAAGPWVRRVLGLVEKSKQPVSGEKFSKGIQLLLPPINQKAAIAIESSFVDKANVLSRGGRSYFIVPWRNHTLVGTTDEIVSGSPDNYRISFAETEKFLDELFALYPDSVFKDKKSLYAFGGLREVREKKVEVPSSGNTVVDHQDYIFEHNQTTPLLERRVQNLVSAIGVKYTTFRGFAERVVDVCEKYIGKRKQCLTATALLPGTPTGDYQRFRRSIIDTDLSSLTTSDANSFVDSYGEDVKVLTALINNDPQLHAIEGEAEKIAVAEVLNAVRNEFAVRLSDVVFRRTTMAAFGFPGIANLEKAANLMAKECGWNEARKTEELNLTLAEFENLHAISFAGEWRQSQN